MVILPPPGLRSVTSAAFMPSRELRLNVANISASICSNSLRVLTLPVAIHSSYIWTATASSPIMRACL